MFHCKNEYVYIFRCYLVLTDNQSISIFSFYSKLIFWQSQTLPKKIALALWFSAAIAICALSFYFLVSSFHKRGMFISNNSFRHIRIVVLISVILFLLKQHIIRKSKHCDLLDHPIHSNRMNISKHQDVKLMAASMRPICLNATSTLASIHAITFMNLHVEISNNIRGVVLAKLLSIYIRRFIISFNTN